MELPICGSGYLGVQDLEFGVQGFIYPSMSIQ